MPARQSTIPERQNEPFQLALLRAMSVSHTRAQRWHLLRTSLAVVLAGWGLVAAFEPAVATPATMFGAAWAVAYSLGLGSWNGSELRRAATLQEMFDVRLFRLPWNPIIASEPLGAQEVSELARRYRGRDDLVRDYYEIPDLPPPYDVLACQQQNLGWGARIRRRYARVVFAAICGWAVAGLVVGMIAELNVTQVLLRWYIPSLGVLLVGLEVYRGQRDIAHEREQALGRLRNRIEAALTPPGSAATETTEALRTYARQIQDLIFLSRCRQTRVPNWFFLGFRADDRTDFRAAMAELDQSIARSVSASNE